VKEAVKKLRERKAAGGDEISREGVEIRWGEVGRVCVRNVQ